MPDGNWPNSPNFLDQKFLDSIDRQNDMFDHIDRTRRETFGLADVIYDRLMKQIKDFQGTLKADEEVGAYLASFGREVFIHIEDVGYHNPYFIIFYGVLDRTGESVELVQHTTQLNVLFRAVPKQGEKARRIGFEGK